MKFKVITLFPDFVRSLEEYSIIGRAIGTKKVSLELINLRDFGIGNYKQVDDKPYGGGAGMLLKVDVVVPAIRSAIKRKSKYKKIVLLSADGEMFTEHKAHEYANLKELVLVCGHYEGHDKRIEDYVDEKISIGEYVVSGGELPAMIIIDAVSRLKSGVINPKSLIEESFSIQKLIRNSDLEIRNSAHEPPQYTRPEIFENKKVPEVLLSGDPKKIEEWKKQLQISKLKSQN